MQSWRLLIKLSESVSTFRIVQKMWLQWPFFYACTKRFGIEEVLFSLLSTYLYLFKSAQAAVYGTMAMHLRAHSRVVMAACLQTVVLDYILIAGRM